MLCVDDDDCVDLGARDAQIDRSPYLSLPVNGCLGKQQSYCTNIWQVGCHSSPLNCHEMLS